MPGPWEQYQQASSIAAKPWEQYQQASEETMDTGGIPAQRRSYSVAEIPGEAVKNLPSSASTLLTGVQQAVTHPLQTLTGMLDIGAGALRKALPQGVVDLVDKIDNNPQATKRAIDTANAVGGVLKDRYGSYEDIKRTFAEDPIGAVGDLSSLLTGGGAALIRGAGTLGKLGVGTSGLVKAGEALKTAGNITNVMRPVERAIAVPVNMLGKGVGAIYNAVDPKSAAYLAAVEDRGPAVLNALRQPTEIVSGSLPTAAEAAAKVGAAKFSAMGQSAKATLPSQYLERELANKEAKIAALRQVGKTPEELSAAETTRRETAKKLYRPIDEAVVTPDKTFNDLMNRPSMKNVINRAVDLAAEKGVPFKTKNLGQPDPISVSPILDKEGVPFKTVDKLGELSGKAGGLSGSGLHAMKTAFDDLIKNPERFGIGAAEVSAIKGTREQFIKWVKDKVPAYETARKTFAEQSAPINQMEVGQFLEKKLVPALGEETANLRSAGFANALENAPGTIKRATGEARYQKLEQILTPEQMKIVESVRSDMARERLTEMQANAARGGGPNLNLMGSEVLSEFRAPNMINNVTTFANDLMRRFMGKMDRKLAIEVATEMLDPAVAAESIRKARARQMLKGALAKPFTKTGQAASRVLRTPAMMNAMSPIVETQNALSEE